MEDSRFALILYSFMSGENPVMVSLEGPGLFLSQAAEVYSSWADIPGRPFNS